MSDICYSPVKGLDDVIASKVIGWNKHLVANLRGIYKEKHPDASDPTAEILIEFRRNLNKEDSKRLLKAINSPTVSYRQLKDDFNAEERFNRINMISTMFSGIIDEVQEANPEKSRKEICSGFFVEGNQVGGIAGIFNEIYDRLQERYSSYVEEGDSEMVAKYQKIFNNWGALISFAKIRIKESEDLKLGQEINFADDSNPNNFNDNDMSEKFIMEESKKEGWMEQSEFMSSFGSISKQVRKVIARTPQYKDGEVVTDDLGFPIMQDAVRVHQELLDILKGIGNESEMIDALKEYSNTVGWVTPFLEELEDPVVRTQFYSDFKKNFQPYSMQTEEREGKIRTYKTAILNKVKGNKPFSSFLTAVKLGKIINPTRSIFEKSGLSSRVMPVKVERLKNSIIETLQISEKEQEDYNKRLEEHMKSPLTASKPRTPKSAFDNMSKLDKKLFLIKVTESLNIDVDGDTIDRLLAKKYNLKNLTDQILQIAQFGLNLTNEEKSGEATISYEDLIKRSSSNEKKGVLREKLTKSLAIISKSREGLKLENRIRAYDNTFYSQVIPSFMGDRFDKIEMFSRKSDSKGLKEWLDTNYLNSSYFKYEGKILNKWIEELYNSDLTSEDNFANNFKYSRFLGGQDTEFGDFTKSMDIISLMNMYFSEKQISANSQYAWYPVFILGDSGVRKFIKAKRYSSQEILDGLYNVYIQERRRMELTKAVNKKMSDQGIKTIDNFSKNGDKYSLLPFLNEDKYSSLINEGNLEQSVKNAIKVYMDDALKDFKKQVENLGVLDKVGTQYVHLSQEVKGNKTVDQVLADYYWNSKFATIQQLQMMTIDPSFYKGTKDLQKRYKEIHAPGSAVSVDAINPFTGERYSNDGIERCVYFDDITVDAENFDPDFMKAIAKHFGKNSDIYKSYKKNVLADGQGYRTLESYRKVMGMAGKWDERMENAYNQIQAIRTRIGKDTNPSMKDIKAISDLAVIFQPIKPYMFTFENFSVNGNDKLKIPVQHKYAEAVLIPELLPAGSMLRDIAYWMEEHVNPETKESEPIDMIGAWSTGGDKIVKVGGFGSTALDYVTNNRQEYIDKEGNVIEDGKKNPNFKKLAIPIDSGDKLNTQLSYGYTHQLSYADYRIQTNVPEDVNSSQLFGTQVRKLGLSTVKDDKDYSHYIGGELINLGGKYKKVKLTGINLRRLFNSLIVANIIESQHIFEKSLANPNNISSKLIQTTANNSRESKDNILAYSLNDKGEFTVPLFEGGLEHDSAALLFSFFKKIVNKQSIKGGSAVQVSAMGITGYEEDGGLRYVVDDPKNPKNILYAECEIPWDLSYTDSNGEEHFLDFETYCNEDGTIKVDSNGEALIEKVYPNILKLLAYRIPTERDYSMINLRVVRFSHKTAGGTIKVPPQGTTIAGFDFDIDKLYFMRYEFKQRQLSSEEIKNIWSEFYNTYPNLKAVLQEAREEDTESLDRLYKYWEKAGLPYSYQAAFNQFIFDKGYTKFEEYDKNISPLENSRAVRNNMLIHILQERLSDIETFKNRYTPGGFANASKAARVLRELIFGNIAINRLTKTVNLSSIRKSIDEGKLEDPEPNYDPSDPMTIVTYNQQNNVAGKLIGIFANQNTNTAYATAMQEFSLKESITFAGKSFRDLLHNDEIDTSLTVAEFLAASVDAVKDPVLNFLNLNTITADAGAMLARLGFTTEDIGLLFNQPIIKDICEYSFNNNMSDINSVIDNVLDTYQVKGEIKKAISSEFDSDQLAYNIVRSTNEDKKALMMEEEFVKRQIHVAELFRNILEASNDVSQFVTNTKFTASNAVGSTFGDAYAQQMKIAAYVKSFKKSDALKIHMKVSPDIYIPINDDNSPLFMHDQEYMEHLLENPFAYEQAMYDMNRKAEKAINKFYPYNTKAYREAREWLAKFTRSGVLNAETINSIHSELMVYMLSQQENSLFNGSMPINVAGEVVSSREYFTEIFPEGLFNILESNPELKSMPIFQYMQFSIDEDTNKVSMNIQDIGGLAPYQKDEIRESWEDLLLNENTAEIAQSLFLYNYFKLGFTFSHLSFMNLAPTEVKLAIKVGYDYDGNSKSYVDFLNEVQEEKVGVNSQEFAKQYLLNHLDNERLVFNPKGRSGKIISDLAFNNGVAVKNFILNTKTLGKDANVFLLPSKNSKVNVFRPVIVIDDLVYMCNSGESEFNQSSTGSMEYFLVESLGESGKSLQYNFNGEASKGTVPAKVKIQSNTSVEPEVTNVPNNSLSIEDLITEAIDLVMKKDNSLQRDMVIEMLQQTSREDLIDTIEALKAQYKSVTDQKGNKIC